MWQDGNSVGGGYIIPNKVEVRVVVDFLKGLIRWYQDGHEIGAAALRKQFMEGRVVAYLLINYPNDTIVFNKAAGEV